jgi:hypothetical protein
MLTSKEHAIDSIYDSIKGEYPDTTCSSVFKDKKGGTSGFPQSLLDDLHREGLAISNSGVVGWTDRSVLHPNRWPLKRRLFDTSVILFYEFFT